MSTSSASMAASKLLSLRTAAFQSLVRRQLPRPSVASAHLLQSTTSSPDLSDPQLLNSFHLENTSTDSVKHPSSARNVSLDPPDFLLNTRWPFGPSVMQIVAARRCAPSSKRDDDVYDDFDEYRDEDDDDDDPEFRRYSMDSEDEWKDFDGDDPDPYVRRFNGGFGE